MEKLLAFMACVSIAAELFHRASLAVPPVCLAFFEAVMILQLHGMVVTRIDGAQRKANDIHSEEERIEVIAREEMDPFKRITRSEVLVDQRTLDAELAVKLLHFISSSNSIAEFPLKHLFDEITGDIGVMGAEEEVERKGLRVMQCL